MKSRPILIKFAANIYIDTVNATTKFGDNILNNVTARWRQSLRHISDVLVCRVAVTILHEISSDLTGEPSKTILRSLLILKTIINGVTTISRDVIKTHFRKYIWNY